MTRRGWGLAGLSTSFGTVTGFGLSPLLAAPAYADGFDDLFFEPMLTVITAGTGFASTLPAADAEVDVPGLAAGLAAEPTDLPGLLVFAFNQFIYEPVQAAGQWWVTGPLGQALDPIINAPTAMLFGRDLIGNGIDGFTDPNTSIFGGSGIFGDFGDGGFWYGNGGAGADAVLGDDGTVVAAGAGGSAGLIGDGGPAGPV